MIGIAMLMACAPSGDTDPPEPSEVPVDPQPWTFEGETTNDPIDLDAVGDALDRAIVEVLTYDARHLVDGYLDRVATSSTPSCPDIVEDEAGNRYWLSGCQASDGSQFAGFLFHYPQVDVSDGTWLFTGDSLTGNARLTSPNGAAIDIQGTTGFLSGVALDGSSQLVVSTVSGGFGMDDAPPGWLADGPQSVEIGLLGLTFTAVEGALVQATGSVVTTVDGDTYAVAFAESAMASGAISDCDLEPGGVVEVRDASGRWIDIEFDGPVVDVSPGDPAACDGCGRAWFDGAEQGLVCADFSPWLNWEALP